MSVLRRYRGQVRSRSASDRCFLDVNIARVTFKACSRPQCCHTPSLDNCFKLTTGSGDHSDLVACIHSIMNDSNGSRFTHVRAAFGCPAARRTPASVKNYSKFQLSSITTNCSEQLLCTLLREMQGTRPTSSLTFTVSFASRSSKEIVRCYSLSPRLVRNLPLWKPLL